jgi:hypothetical protein
VESKKCSIQDTKRYKFLQKTFGKTSEEKQDFDGNVLRTYKNLNDKFNLVFVKMKS